MALDSPHYASPQQSQRGAFHGFRSSTRFSSRRGLEWVTESYSRREGGGGERTVTFCPRSSQLSLANQSAEAAQSARRVRNCRCAPMAGALPSAPRAGHLGVARGCAVIRSRTPTPTFGSTEITISRVVQNPFQQRFTTGPTLLGTGGGSFLITTKTGKSLRAQQDARERTADTPQVRSSVLSGRGGLGLRTTTPRPGCLSLLLAAFVGQVEEVPSDYVEWRYLCVTGLQSRDPPHCPC